MIKTLLVAYSFLPLEEAQSLRWAYLSDKLCELGYEIDVVTIKLPSGFGEEFKFSKDLEIHRVFAGVIETLAFNAKKTIGAGASFDASKRTAPSFKTMRFFYRAVRRLMDQLLIGDIRSEWLPFVVSYLGRLNIDKYDLLITSQEPFIDSLIGLYLKKTHGNLVWLADFGDTAFAPYIPVWRRPLDRAIEKHIMRVADGVVFTNPYAASLVGWRYGLDKKKVLVLPQGYPSFSFEDKEKTAKLTMFFSGTFYKGFREPYALVEAVGNFDREIKLVVAGRNDAFVDKFLKLDDRVEYLGFVSHREVLSLQRKADILVNVSNKQSHQIPGKFFEYLGANRPILNIVYSKNDPTARLVEELGVGFVCMNDESAIKEELEHVWGLWHADKLQMDFDRKRNKDRIRLYSWEKLARVLDGFVRGIIGRKKNTDRRKGAWT